MTEKNQSKEEYIMWHVKSEVLVAHLCQTLYDAMDCSPPGPSAHGISQARILEWVAIPISRESSWPRVWTPISCIAGRFFTVRKIQMSVFINKALLKHMPEYWFPWCLAAFTPLQQCLVVAIETVWSTASNTFAFWFVTEVWWPCSQLGRRVT